MSEEVTEDSDIRGDRRRPRGFIAMLALATLLSATGSGRLAHGATITVTTTDDVMATNGTCSLRKAIQTANTNAAVDGCLRIGNGPDAIVFDAVVFDPSGGSRTITLTGQLPSITESVTITGTGATLLIIDAHAALQGLVVYSPAVVTISGLTVMGATNNSTGGGIFNNGNLTLIDVIVRNNQANSGGGIWNQGTMTLLNVTVKDNTADNPTLSSGGYAGAGGGIGNYRTGATLKIMNSTISGNTAKGFGGGILNDGSDTAIGGGGTVTLINSTVSGNSAVLDETGHGAGGGGFDNYSNGNGTATLNLVSSTISGNTAGYAGGILSQSVGPSSQADAQVNAKNTIIANNSPDTCHGTFWTNSTFTSAGFNLISPVGNCPVGGNTTCDIYDQNPNLGPLAKNGGATETLALCTGSGAPDPSCAAVSPAMNPVLAGSCTAFCTDLASLPVTTDQRGVARPQGPKCDIGAYEAPIPPPHCAFEHPSSSIDSKTGIVDTRLVQAFVPTDHCTLCGESSNDPNAQTQGGVPAFQPPLASNAAGSGNPWLWGPVSQPSWGRVKLTRTTSTFCPAGDLGVRLWLRKILDATGALIPSSDGILKIVLRAAVYDPANGDMTMADVPLSVPFTLTDGAVTFTSTAGALGLPCLPSCSNVEVASITVLDGNRNAFARPGIWLP